MSGGGRIITWHRAETLPSLSHATQPRSPGTIGGWGENLDADLETLDRAGLVAEIRRLRAGIRRHRGSSGHDLCWHHPELWGLLPEQMEPAAGLRCLQAGPRTRASPGGSARRRVQRPGTSILTRPRPKGALCLRTTTASRPPSDCCPPAAAGGHPGPHQDRAAPAAAGPRLTGELASIILLRVTTERGAASFLRV
jgi:hypothetical protein